MEVYCECSSGTCSKAIELSKEEYKSLMAKGNLVLAKGCNIDPGDEIVTDHGEWLEVKGL